MDFHAEFGEDKWLEDNYKYVLDTCPQFGVDVGCGDPTCHNNTAWLREKGWAGLAIDGNPSLQGKWNGNSWPFVCAVLSSSPMVRFLLHPCEVLSRICSEGTVVNAVSLESILTSRNIGEIGLLSIDIEGSEYDVLSGVNIELHKPRIIIAEYSTDCIGNDFRVRDWLTGTGKYSAVHQTKANIIYIRK